MFDGPIRGGTRGGQGEFKWSDVSADKDRENYLGHSINAPTGRWQKNKDVHWYNRDIKASEAERLEEIRKVKEAEEDALAVALGYKPAVRPAPGTEAPAVGDGGKAMTLEDPALLAAKEERRRRKEERRKRKDEKREQKELRHLQRGSAKREEAKEVKFDDDDYDTSRRRLRDTSVTRSQSRSWSPRRPSRRNEGKIASRSPNRDNEYRNHDARAMEKDRYAQRNRIDKRPYDSEYERGRGRDRW